MAAPTNVVSTLVSKGNREDLEDVVYRVAATVTPFIQAIGDTKATAVTHEWQTETLAAPNAANAQLEGDDVVAFDTPNLTTRVGNLCQIFRKTGVVTRTQDVVKSAGRSSDYKRQQVLRGKEVMRDMEMAFLANQGTQQESGSTPRRTAGALAWMSSHVSRGSGGASGGNAGGSITTAATNATATRTWTEALLKSVMAQCFADGGTPSIVMMGGTLKQSASAFTGIAQNRHETGDKMAKIIAGADIYISDFGELTFAPHPYALSRDALFVDPDMWAVATLDPVHTEELAKTGDSDKFMIVAEKALVCRNEKGSGVASDLNP